MKSISKAMLKTLKHLLLAILYVSIAYPILFAANNPESVICLWNMNECPYSDDSKIIPSYVSILVVFLTLTFLFFVNISLEDK